MSTEELLEKFGINVTYLNPCSLTPNVYKSKMGGKETYVLDEIFNCSCCKKQTSLIIEIFQTDFDEFYFPENFDYVQVKTCYNKKCNNDEFYLAYGKIQKLEINTKKSNTHIPDVYLNPIKALEIPFNTYETKEQIEYIQGTNMDAYESKIYDYTAKIGTKINGDIFSWQEMDIPVCDCGNKKNHILQISSYEPNIHPNENRPYYEWDSSIGVFVGEVGNYHYFICKVCGFKTIESTWDSR
jgi:hypothetical protein